MPENEKNDYEYVLANDETGTIIITDKELDILFPNKQQKEIFSVVITRLANAIIEFSSLKAVKVNFD